MKKLVSNSYLAIFILLLVSCSKDNSFYLFANEEAAARLESAIYPVVTKPAEMTIGTEFSVAYPGEMMTVFVPYRISADDIQSARIIVKDEISGAIVREIEMTPSNDPSVLNVSVPEEIQGTSFLFVNIPIQNDLVGLNLSLSSRIVGNKLSSEGSISDAFRVQ